MAAGKVWPWAPCAVIARLAIEGASAASTSSDGGASSVQPESRPLAEERQNSREDAQTYAGIAPTAVADEDASRLEADAVATPSALSAPHGAEDVVSAEGAEGKQTPAASSDPDTVYAGPAVRKLAREFGVTLLQV